MVSYTAFGQVFEDIENHADLRYCGCEVPRTKNGWPTIEPEAFDDLQLFYEAARWRSTARSTGPQTVGGSCWVKYTDELIRRHLMDEDCQKRHDIRKVLKKGWNDLPPGPIVVDPVVPKPVLFDPKANSFFDRVIKAIKSTIKIN